ncbi:MAG: hypothetical protein KDK63_03320, partial [Chlamydiia bacterium]|nr:hypothetical protein [Chlamydiia bacterium]
AKTLLLHFDEFENNEEVCALIHSMLLLNSWDSLKKTTLSLVKDFFDATKVNPDYILFDSYEFFIYYAITENALELIELLIDKNAQTIMSTPGNPKPALWIAQWRSHLKKQPSSIVVKIKLFIFIHFPSFAILFKGILFNGNSPKRTT